MKPLAFILSCLLLATCITPYDPEITENISKLVVDGTITDQPGPHIIRLSYSSAFVNAETYDGRAVSGASVAIEDNDGVNTPLEFTKNGIYLTPVTFVGVVGKEYSLKIKLPNGKEYRSHPEPLRAIAPIDSIISVYRRVTRTFLRGEFDVSIQFKDPPTKGDFYSFRWVHYNLEDYCKVKLDPETRILYVWGCCEPCWSIDRCPSCINVLSDKYVNGSNIKVPISTVPFDSRLPYFITVEQRSLSENAHNFWKTVSTQVNNSGGIFDSPPITIPGNLYGVTDPEEQVLGYFGASAIATRSVHIKRDKVPESPFEIPREPPYPLPECIPCNSQSGLRTSIQPKDWVTQP